MVVESVFRANRELRGYQPEEVTFRLSGMGQDTINHARRSYPGFRLVILGWFIKGKDKPEYFKPVDLSSEYTLKGKI